MLELRGGGRTQVRTKGQLGSKRLYCFSFNLGGPIPLPPPSLPLSLSAPPPFIGSRISKSLVVKSAAALLCLPACLSRSILADADGREDGQRGGIASGGTTARRTAGRARNESGLIFHPFSQSGRVGPATAPRPPHLCMYNVPVATYLSEHRKIGSA